jgi:hypothetical protein
LTRQDQAVLWLAALAMQAAAALAVVPIYLIVHRYSAASTAWRAAALWPLVPALAIFLPKSDVLYPFVGLSFVWLWLEATRRRSVLRSFVAGVVFWLGLSLSLALLPVAFFAVTVSVWEAWCHWSAITRREQKPGISEMPGFWRSAQLRHLVICGAGAAVVFGALSLIVWLATGMNLFTIWAWNYRNHAAFYSHWPRTFWKWLLVNPVEFAMAAGLPVALLALCGIARSMRRGRDPAAGLTWAALITWGLLLLSGKNMGEAARLWIFSLPWVICIAAPLLCDGSPRDGTESPRGAALWWVALVLQTAACLTLITRVVGFHVPAAG